MPWPLCVSPCGGGSGDDRKFREWKCDERRQVAPCVVSLKASTEGGSLERLARTLLLKRSSPFVLRSRERPDLTEWLFEPRVGRGDQSVPKILHLHSSAGAAFQTGYCGFRLCSLEPAALGRILVMYP